MIYSKDDVRRIIDELVNATSQHTFKLGGNDQEKIHAVDIIALEREAKKLKERV